MRMASPHWENVIADAHLEATLEAGAVVAFMNQGGIRNDILFASSGPENDGELTYAEAFSVHPFGNSLVTMTLTGHQIDETSRAAVQTR